MKIGLIHSRVVPVEKYGGTERVVWWLGKELAKRGHEITLMAPKGSSCSFGRFVVYDPLKSIDSQIPDELDLVHLHFITRESILKKPYLITCHGNGQSGEEFDVNTVFVSGNHAKRHGAEAFVYNGIDTNEYGVPNLDIKRNHLHFLANAAWRVKNVRGAIRMAQQAKLPLEVMGGKRLNLKMGFRLTLDPRIHFHGQLGGAQKLNLIGNSRALLFPVLWHEPFGLAIIESMYFGCPIFATPWGSLPELVPPEMGFLSASLSEHVEQLNDFSRFDHKKIHEHVCDNFGASQMAEKYLGYYEQVVHGKSINAKQPVAAEAAHTEAFNLTA